MGVHAQQIHTSIAQFLHLRLRNTEEKVDRLQKPEDQEVCHETMSSRYDCTNKTSTMTLSIDLLGWKWENLIIPQVTNDVGDNWSLPGMCPLIGYLMQSRQFPNHIYTNDKNRLTILFVYIYTHVWG